MAILREDEAGSWGETLRKLLDVPYCLLLDLGGGYVRARACSLCCDSGLNARTVSVGVWVCACVSEDRVCVFNLYVLAYTQR